MKRMFFILFLICIANIAKAGGIEAGECVYPKSSVGKNKQLVMAPIPVFNQNTQQVATLTQLSPMIVLYSKDGWLLVADASDAQASGNKEIGWIKANTVDEEAFSSCEVTAATMAKIEELNQTTSKASYQLGDCVMPTFTTKRTANTVLYEKAGETPTFNKRGQRVGQLVKIDPYEVIEVVGDKVEIIKLPRDGSGRTVFVLPNTIMKVNPQICADAEGG